jgi:surface polysaccharide O-acyltransferase-like enzyme
MNASRNCNIDILEAVAMILVVAQHAWSMLDLDKAELGLLCFSYQAIVTIGVPLFVFASGVLLLSREIEPLTLFFKKRLKRLLIPFLLFSIVVYAVSLFIGAYAWWDGSMQMAITKFIPLLLTGEINVFFWFVYMLLCLYFITPILQRALHQLSKSDLQLILSAWAIGLLLKQFYPAFALNDYISAIWKYLGVYISGYYVFKYCVGKQQYCYIGAISLFLLYVANVLTNCSITLIFPLTAIAIGLICLNLNVATDNSITKIVTNISRYSYTIYLTHILLIRFIYMFTEQYFGAMTNFVPLLITLPIVAIIYVACNVYSKIKILPNYIVGIG